jgi:cytochrome d ubiquinol oxidase subunit II
MQLGTDCGLVTQITCLVGLWAVSIFPALVPDVSGIADRALTVFNASSSQLTLTVMLIVALVGVPIMLAYTAIVYRRMVGVGGDVTY